MIHYKRTVTELTPVYRTIEGEMAASPGFAFLLKQMLFPQNSNTPVNRVEAIKAIRIEFGYELKEAKEIVDSLTPESFDPKVESTKQETEQPKVQSLGDLLRSKLTPRPLEAEQAEASASEGVEVRTFNSLEEMLNSIFQETKATKDKQ